MYITNNRLITDGSFSSEINLLNYITDDNIILNDNVIAFQELIAGDYVMPRLYVKGSDASTINFIEFFENRPPESNLDIMRNMLSYGEFAKRDRYSNNEYSSSRWSSFLFEVNMTDELLSRLKKILTHFTDILSDDINQDVAIWDANTITSALENVTLEDIDGVIAKETWTARENLVLGIFVVKAMGNTPYDLIINDLLSTLDNSSSNTI